MSDFTREEAEQIVRDTIAQCLQLARRKDCPLQPALGFNPQIRMSWAKHHRTSHGSRKRVFFAMEKNIEGAKSPYLFKEYARIANEPVIGSFWTHDWRNIYRVLACHEFAHALQYAPRSRMGNWRAEYKKPHGRGWQRLYAYFRHASGLNARVKNENNIIACKRTEQAPDQTQRQNPCR